MKNFFSSKKIKSLKKKFKKISNLIIKPKIISNNKIYAKISRKYKKIYSLINLYKSYKTKKKDLKKINLFLFSEKDIEMKNLAQSEKIQILYKLKKIKKKIFFLNSKKKNNKNIILELRSGAGGNEACLFVKDILRMYLMYFKQKKWKYKIINIQENSLKGYKEVIVEVYGKKSYDLLKLESGVHRVQRVPETESQGRVHTSTITVAVLPKIKSINIKINILDIKRDTFKSSGAGGQHVNKTESAVRLTHIPTGIIVECQDERSQHKNFKKAMKILKSRIFNLKKKKTEMKRAGTRKYLISTGDRSEKIRTYNYSQGRVTDHRINKSIYSLEGFMNGNIQKMIDALIKTKKLL